MADDGTFSVDIEELRRGGVDIEHLATLAATIYGDLHNVTSKYGRRLGGNGDTQKAFEANYYPAAEDSEGFLRDLKDLVDTHGGKTILLGGLFGDVNDTTITESGSGGHGRKG
ncbi:hypothetical protein [Actinoallomurus iriomotensis]|jgi:hypothetical protein|uniref:Uncharacterized protein n=1 Tax=Actinoallomurus iriomotensis TaxID=478107 RepID=A0A9W6VYD2_9ACTN|nr:hypothetical protein [Actinoallomurus iriomotensis]GLY83557.1 hypothetical protein Airi02_014870 [Actinoallomurus iriomotensis]